LRETLITLCLCRWFTY